MPFGLADHVSHGDCMPPTGPGPSLSPRLMAPNQGSRCQSYWTAKNQANPSNLLVKTNTSRPRGALLQRRSKTYVYPMKIPEKWNFGKFPINDNKVAWKGKLDDETWKTPELFDVIKEYLHLSSEPNQLIEWALHRVIHPFKNSGVFISPRVKIDEISSLSPYHISRLE